MTGYALMCCGMRVWQGVQRGDLWHGGTCVRGRDLLWYVVSIHVVECVLLVCATLCLVVQRYVVARGAFDMVCAASCAIIWYAVIWHGVP